MKSLNDLEMTIAAVRAYEWEAARLAVRGGVTKTEAFRLLRLARLPTKAKSKPTSRKGHR